MNDKPEPGREPGLDAAYSLETPEDNRALYGRWADTYEADFIAPRGYVYHHHVAALFAREQPERAGATLDVGCGTGIVGVALGELGFSVIDGLDLSPEMLAKSEEKGVYRTLVEADLTAAIPLADDVYDGVVSVGTFTHGHVGPAAIAELIRVAAPGARFALGINAEHFEAHGFAAEFDALVSAGRISPPTFEHVRIYESGTDDHADDHADDLALVVLFRFIA